MKCATASIAVLLLVACSGQQMPPPVAIAPAGVVAGVVVDVNGARLPGVTVMLRGDGFYRAMVTDVRGEYQFVNVPRGNYQLQSSLSGFGVAARRVNVGDSGVRVRMTMNMNVVAEAITVTAEAPSTPGEHTYRPPTLSPRRAPVPRPVAAAVPPPAVAPPVPVEVVSGSPQYATLVDHDFVDTQQQATTTFAIDVDRASYANVRRFLASNHMPPVDAVRVEEMINYFHYDYAQPSGADPFSITTEVASCPWAPTHRLVRIGIQGRNLDEWRMAPNNLVFLIDVSGSMTPMERLPLIVSSFRLLVDKLRAEDRVAIVVYAGAAGVVLPSTSGADKQTIIASLNQLRAGGSTAGAAGIELAYKVAKENFIAGGNNRVILATDGDFNVGINRLDDLLKFIEEKRELGIDLTTIGVGDDNYHDATMELLADHGNGNYSYLDTPKEAAKVFQQELTGTLVTIAKDVKVQIQFDPARVASYRQIGYENRALENKDFDDDKKDAGELGAGHSVTALYEIVPAATGSSGQIATIRLRYKQPHGDASSLITSNVTDTGSSIYAASPDFQFAVAVAEFGMLLRKSAHKGTASYADALALARQSRGADLDGTREELIRMIDSSRALSGEAPTAVAVQ